MKKILREYIELPLGENVVKNKSGNLILKNVILSVTETKNNNSRVYPKKILERELGTYLSIIKERRALGELDHPEESTVQLRNASHIITEAWWDPKNPKIVRGNIEILNTPMGKIFESLYKDRIKMGVSSRGVGSLLQEGENLIVQDDYKLICWDIVSEPSTSGAWFQTISEGYSPFKLKELKNYNIIKEDLLRNYNEFLKGVE